MKLEEGLQLARLYSKRLDFFGINYPSIRASLVPNLANAGLKVIRKDIRFDYNNALEKTLLY